MRWKQPFRTGSGTQNVGHTVQGSLIANATTYYRSAEGMVASYDSYHASAGQLPLTVEQYEGGGEWVTPTTNQCTTMGISGTSTVPTFQNQSPYVVWPDHPLSNGDRVSFTSSGGTLPNDIGSSWRLFVMNASSASFYVSLSYYDGSAIAQNYTQSGPFTASYCQAMDNLLDAYRMSTTYGPAIVLPHSKTPSCLTFQVSAGQGNGISNFGISQFGLCNC